MHKIFRTRNTKLNAAVANENIFPVNTPPPCVLGDTMRSLLLHGCRVSRRAGFIPRSAGRTARLEEHAGHSPTTPPASACGAGSSASGRRTAWTARWARGSGWPEGPRERCAALSALPDPRCLHLRCNSSIARVFYLAFVYDHPKLTSIMSSSIRIKIHQTKAWSTEIGYSHESVCKNRVQIVLGGNRSLWRVAGSKSTGLGYR